MRLTDALDALLSRRLTEQESYDVLIEIFQGSADIEDIKQLLVILSQDKGETVDEIVGFARAMRDHMTQVHLKKPMLDLCGTGGSGQDRFNASTAAAFVLAAGGVPVAKHGNRGSKKPNGSFDFLEALGIPFEHTADQCAALFDQTNLCFLFARQFHPAMKYVAPARQAVGHRTLFNLLGPLCNPAGATHQILGTLSNEIANKLAQALMRLGTNRTLVIVGHNGLDELSLTGKSEYYEVKSNEIKPHLFIPESNSADLLPVGNAIENAAQFLTVLQDKNALADLRQFIALNAAAGFYCMNRVEKINDGIKLANDLITSGEVYRFLETYKIQANRISAIS